MGGKAAGLLFLEGLLRDRPPPVSGSGSNGATPSGHPGFTLDVPALVVLGAGLFEAFLERNALGDLLAEGVRDEVVLEAFRRAKLPAEAAGDLWALAAEARLPLAVRSSSVLEDDAGHPLAGVYGTKLIPGSQPSAEARFAALTDAIKFVYASALLGSARAARVAAGLSARDERMAVVVQEVVGLPHGPRFYPDASGVLRSWNVYPTGASHPEDGVAMLALGLGKTIVDGGLAWSFSPAHPRARPPFGSPRDVLKATQTRFWAVNRGKPPAYDPMAETEYMVQSDLAAAEEDGVLPRLASTYDAAADRIVPGTGRDGPRVLDFAPLLLSGELPKAFSAVLHACQEAMGTPVELEIAISLPRDGPGGSAAAGPGRLGLLQVRPILMGAELVEVSEPELEAANVVLASRSALGNGRRFVSDVVFVERERFDALATRKMAEELRLLNGALAAEGRPYLLIGFGRFGSADPYLGIPARWEGLAGAAAIVEVALPLMNPDPSQGSHFFHNLVAAGTAYLTVPLHGRVDWEFLERQETVRRSPYLRHVRTARPLEVRVDGRARRAVVLREDGEGR